VKPSVAVRNDGTIGVSFSDFRGDLPGDGALTARVWLERLSPGARAWSEVPLSEAFDLRNMQTPGPSWPGGDYFGLAASPAGFFAAWTEPSADPTRDGQTDIVFTRVGGIGRGDGESSAARRA
jgi:hypothetical protein